MTEAPARIEGVRLVPQGHSVLVEFDTSSAAGLVKDRVLLPIDTVRRLALQLDEALRPHEAALRAAAAQGLSPQRAAMAVRQAQAQPVPGPLGPAADLLRRVAELGRPVRREHSFRMSAAGLDAERFLATIARNDITGDGLARVMEICAAFAMPAEQRAACAAGFAQASAVHFGFEGDPAGQICKLYLERKFAPQDLRAARDVGAPLCLHDAWKWRLDGSLAVDSQYLWYPLLTRAQLEARLVRLYEGRDDHALAMAEDVLALALTRLPAERLHYLEVSEAGTGRASFDLNLYDAGLNVRDILPILQRARAHFGIRPGGFQALADRIGNERLGHLAGGLHRGGGGFFNIYYGVALL